jgi:xanthine dehydrogenase/oxidase
LQVLNQAILLNSAYNIPCARIKAFLCKTNTPSSTAFRGFGAPQRLFFIENVISKISYAVGKPLNMVSMYIVDNLYFEKLIKYIFVFLYQRGLGFH